MPDKTFDLFLNNAWEYSEPSIRYWEKKLTQYEKDHSELLNALWSLMTTFYGRENKRGLTTVLHLSPKDGNRGGGPITNFMEVSDNPLFEGLDFSMGDIVMWMPYVEFHKEGGTTTFARDQDILGDLFHEAEHLFLQGKRFFKTIKRAEKDVEVKKTLSQIKEGQEWFINITMELITLYSNSYIIDRLFDEKLPRISPTSKWSNKYKTNEQDFKRLLYVIIKDDVDRLGGVGADASKRKAWDTKAKGLPQKYSKDYNSSKTTQENRSPINVYIMAEKLPKNLIVDYIEKGKQLDEEFIIQMYQLVQRFVDNQ